MCGEYERKQLRTRIEHKSWLTKTFVHSNAWSFARKHSPWNTEHIFCSRCTTNRRGACWTQRDQYPTETTCELCDNQSTRGIHGNHLCRLIAKGQRMRRWNEDPHWTPGLVRALEALPNPAVRTLCPSHCPAARTKHWKALPTGEWTRSTLGTYWSIEFLLQFSPDYSDEGKAFENTLASLLHFRLTLQESRILAKTSELLYNKYTYSR